MKKIFFTTFLSIAAISMILPFFAYGDATQPNIPGTTVITGATSPTGILNILKNVVSAVYTVFFILAVLFVLWAAFTYLTSGGDVKKVDEAKTRIIYAAVAIAVALLSVGFSQIIKGFLTSGTGA